MMSRQGESFVSNNGYIKVETDIGSLKINYSDNGTNDVKTKFTDVEQAESSFNDTVNKVEVLWNETIDIKMESVKDDYILERTDNAQRLNKNENSLVEVGEDSKRDLLPSAIFMNNLRKQEYPCKYCTYVTTQDEDLRFHIKDVHKSQCSFECKLCGLVLKTAAFLRWHLKKHESAKKRYSCEHCKYQSDSHMARHTKNRHPQVKTFTCELCDYKTGYAGGMKSHMNNEHTFSTKDKHFIS